MFFFFLRFYRQFSEWSYSSAGFLHHGRETLPWELKIHLWGFDRYKQFKARDLGIQD